MTNKILIDKDGNPIKIRGMYSNPTKKQLQDAVLSLASDGKINIENGVITDGIWGGLSPVHKQNIDNGCKLLDEETVNNDFSNIPLFCVADTHGAYGINEIDKIPYRLDKVVNNRCPKGTMAIFLGDLCDTVYAEYYLKGQSQMINNMKKSISVVGNHDRATPKDTTINHKMINNWFITKGFKRVDDALYGYWDDYDYNVRYLILDPYEIIPTENASVGQGVRIGTKQMKFLLHNLETCDMDLIILMHQPWNDLNIHRDGTIQNWADAPVIFENTWNVLKDRKNKRSGTITDSDNIVHKYDFTKCESDLICSLHGHTHEELYLQDEGMLEYCFDYGNTYKCCSVVSINRNENKLKVKYFNTETVKDTIELSLSGKNSIVNKLTNVTSSNMATNGVDTNSSYTTTLTATTGTLETITVKMNGTDISSTAVSGNTITINNVVGRVEITASSS